jgi:hypothetical protein
MPDEAPVTIAVLLLMISLLLCGDRVFGVAPLLPSNARRGMMNIIFLADREPRAAFPTVSASVGAEVF